MTCINIFRSFFNVRLSFNDYFQYPQLIENKFEYKKKVMFIIFLN